MKDSSASCDCLGAGASPPAGAVAFAPMSGDAAALVPESLPQGVITSINVSEKKGTRKTPVLSGQARITVDNGVVGDAHAGDWHRQVSFLAEESIARARQMGLDVSAGDFAENFTAQGLSLFSIPVGTLLEVGEAEVEVSQIGKVCHTRCAIYHLAGDCIFPREGIFAVVRKPGDVKVGDAVRVLVLGDGTCDATPPEALAEVEAARAAGTL